MYTDMCSDTCSEAKVDIYVQLFPKPRVTHTFDIQQGCFDIQSVQTDPDSNICSHTRIHTISDMPSCVETVKYLLKEKGPYPAYGLTYVVTSLLAKTITYIPKEHDLTQTNS